LADSQAFDFVCTQLEEKTSLDRLAARGTVRIALKQAGLEARTVTPEQMRVVTERVLPAELQARGIASFNELCSAIGRGLSQLAPSTAGETPDEIFRRLGGGA
jgi:hypothetical protein